MEEPRLLHKPAYHGQALVARGGELTEGMEAGHAPVGIRQIHQDDDIQPELLAGAPLAEPLVVGAVQQVEVEFQEWFRFHTHFSFSVVSAAKIRPLAAHDHGRGHDRSMEKSPDPPPVGKPSVIDRVVAVGAAGAADQRGRFVLK